MTDKITIKIVGEEESAVQHTLDMLLDIFPISIGSKVMKNDRDEGYHALMTVQPKVTDGVNKQ